MKTFKPHILTSIILFLVISLLSMILYSCDDAMINTENVSETITKTNVAKITELVPPPNIEFRFFHYMVQNWITISDDTITIYGCGEYVTRYFVSYDYNGNFINMQQIPHEFDANIGYEYCKPFHNGIIGISFLDQYGSRTLFSSTYEGKVTNTYTIEETDNLNICLNIYKDTIIVTAQVR